MRTEPLICRVVGLRPTTTTLSQPATAKRRSVAESAERILACALGWKALTECLRTQGRVPAVARRKHAVAAIPARPKPRRLRALLAGLEKFSKLSPVSDDGKLRGKGLGASANHS